MFRIKKLIKCYIQHCVEKEVDVYFETRKKEMEVSKEEIKKVKSEMWRQQFHLAKQVEKFENQLEGVGVYDKIVQRINRLQLRKD